MKERSNNYKKYMKMLENEESVPTEKATEKVRNKERRRRN